MQSMPATPSSSTTCWRTQVIPLFNDRDAAGVPHGWCDRVKEALITLAPVFGATRMVNDYVEKIYPA